MTPADNPEQFSVKEILTDVVLPELREIKKDLTARLDAQDAKIEIQDNKLDGIIEWRNRAAGILALVTIVLIPVALPVLYSIVASFPL